jgi:hypothetical protein
MGSQVEAWPVIGPGPFKQLRDDHPGRIVATPGKLGECDCG